MTGSRYDDAWFSERWERYYDVIEEELVCILSERQEPCNSETDLAESVLPDILDDFAIDGAKARNLEAEYEDELRRKFESVSDADTKLALKEWLYDLAFRRVADHVIDVGLETIVPIEFVESRLEGCSDAVDARDTDLGECLRKLGLSADVTYGRIISFVREGGWL